MDKSLKRQVLQKIMYRYIFFYQHSVCRCCVTVSIWLTTDLVLSLILHLFWRNFYSVSVYPNIQPCLFSRIDPLIWFFWSNIDLIECGLVISTAGTVQKIECHKQHEYRTKIMQIRCKWDFNLTKGIHISYVMCSQDHTFICIDWCARSRYQGQGQVITSHRYCGM